VQALPSTSGYRLLPENGERVEQAYKFRSCAVVGNSGALRYMRLGVVSEAARCISAGCVQSDAVVSTCVLQSFEGRLYRTTLSPLSLKRALCAADHRHARRGGKAEPSADRPLHAVGGLEDYLPHAQQAVDRALRQRPLRAHEPAHGARGHLRGASMRESLARAARMLASEMLAPSQERFLALSS
jgi:hypothetical protein